MVFSQKNVQISGLWLKVDENMLMKKINEKKI